MKKLTVEFKHCYGISYLKHDFEFEKHQTIALYAPNGMMKTSFSKTLLNISRGENPQEKIFGNIPEFKLIADGIDFPKEKILVIESINEKFNSDNMTTLLVDSDARKKYEELTKELLLSQDKFINKLNKLSGIVKTKIEQTLESDFNGISFFKHIESINLDDVVDEFSHIPYKIIMDEKVLQMLNEKNFAEKIQDYTDKYNLLLEKSQYYKKGIFNPTKANNILNATKKENFFQAEHSILLHGNPTAFTTYEDLDKTLEKEKADFFADVDLQAIQKQISNGVKSISEFESLLEQYPEIITELKITNIEKLKQKLWLSYFKKEEVYLNTLKELYQSTKSEIEEIEKKAQEQFTKWEQVVDEFKKRFSLPFEILITNKKSAILGRETPNIDFEFTNPTTGVKKTFSKDSLGNLQVLSQGEKRALYLLYVIFEIKGRIKDETDTLIIIDDIADSFDYKNKYAIVEYLNEISKYPFFNQIILTHNFDFFRTVQERILLDAKWHNSLMVDKDMDESLKIVDAGKKNITSPFELWKKEYPKDLKKFISLIPFIRNIIEYAHGSGGDEYKLLTNCLHIKKDITKNIKKKDIQAVFETVGNLYKGKVIDNEEHFILNSIYDCAEFIIASGKHDGILLDDKIVLSIAIRLKAEEYMWDNVTSQSPINGTQTGKLFQRFKDEYQDNQDFIDSINILTRMSIMTPENIHLNSFMYEPLLDMSYGHLVELYNDIKGLSCVI